MKKIFVLSTTLLLGATAFAQSADKGFKKGNGWMEYKIAKDVPGDNHPAVGDIVAIHLHVFANDSMMFDTRMMNNNEPVEQQVTAKQFNGDLMDCLTYMTEGDSAIFRIAVDSVIKNLGDKARQPWMKEGENQKLVFKVVLASLKTQEQYQKEQEAAAAKQIAIDDQLIQDYLKANNINAKKTTEGLYYKIDEAGSGEQITQGQTVSVNYTGKTMDGNVFDSNVDPKFQHVEPFKFAVGTGSVIKGWDIGATLLKKGSKATLYIPSNLAYGPRGTGPIPANAVLIFDIEILDVAN